MFGNVAALEGLHVTGKYRDKSMTHSCSRHAAWDPHMYRLADAASRAGFSRKGGLRVLDAANGTHRSSSRRRTVGQSSSSLLLSNLELSDAKVYAP